MAISSNTLGMVILIYYVYILSNKYNTVLYTGVTNSLLRRVFEHKTHAEPHSFTAKYNINKLVYYEYTSDVRAALEREKQIKGRSRQYKNQLINSINPTWMDLYERINE